MKVHYNAPHHIRICDKATFTIDLDAYNTPPRETLEIVLTNLEWVGDLVLEMSMEEFTRLRDNA